MKFNYSIDIQASSETVFIWIGKPAKAMQWMTSVTKTEMLIETPEMVGSTFRETVSESGEGIEMLGKVTGYEPNKRISFHLESRVNQVDVEYRLEEIPNGTRLTQDADIRWKFPVNIVSALAGGAFRHNLLTQAQQEFNRLKALCEARV
jgi:hypothetical protein